LIENEGEVPAPSQRSTQPVYADTPGWKVNVTEFFSAITTDFELAPSDTVTIAFWFEVTEEFTAREKVALFAPAGTYTEVGTVK
jgi:hypothetical protein